MLVVSVPTKNPALGLGLFFRSPSVRKLTGLCKYLKYSWYQSPADAAAILRIAGQVLGQEFFFVEDPPDEKQQHEGQAQKAPV